MIVDSRHIVGTAEPETYASPCDHTGSGAFISPEVRKPVEVILLFLSRSSDGLSIRKAAALRLRDVCNFELMKNSLLLATTNEEQRKIVAEIEKQFTRLEAGVAGLRRVQANLKRYRAAVLKAACEGKLVPTEAELARQEGRTYETGAQLLERILTERRKKWSGKGKYLAARGENGFA